MHFREKHLIDIFNLYEDQKKPLDVFLRGYFRLRKSIGSKDRRFIADTAYELVRWRGLIDFLSNSSDWQEKISFYLQMEWKKAIFDENIPPHIRVSFPKYYLDKMGESYGEKRALEICLTSNKRAPTAIRVNLLKIGRDELFSRLKDKFRVELGEVNSSIIFEQNVNFFALDEFKEGLFEIQDEGSQIVSSLVEAKAGDEVLDFCAGSGGKTLSFAPQMSRKGQIYLYDTRLFSLEKAKKRLKRAGIENAQVVGELKSIPKRMDWILLDVPCSGSGTLRRNPDLKWRFLPSMLEELVLKQREIFEKAFPFLGSDGKIVYSTCSIISDENEDQIDYFQKKYGLRALKTFKCLPQEKNKDGFFGCVLARS